MVRFTNPRCKVTNLFGLRLGQVLAKFGRKYLGPRDIVGWAAWRRELRAERLLSYTLGAHVPNIRRTMANILIAEDDTSLARITQNWLSLTDKHKVDLAIDGAETWEMLQAFSYDVLVLDWEMPKISGIEILRKLRHGNCMMPVLILTGKNQVEDKELALDEGADDYLTKPFHPRELSARLRALLRRPPQIATKLLAVRSISVDPNLRKVLRDGVEVSVQPLEFDLLEFFLRHPNQVFSIDLLLQRVWGADADVSLEAVYSCIKRLRKKLDKSGEPSIIKTIFGTGYCLET